jgi:diacylglycerol kinase (ATP)
MIDNKAMHRRKVRFIINPISGIGKQKRIRKLIDYNADLAGIDIDIAYTEAAGHATELARAAAQAGYDAVIAVGGDGSINEVARGLVGTNTAIGIIPAGSGNGFAHFIGIPFRTSSAIKTIAKMKVKQVDTATINDEFFVSVAGVGFDAFVADKFSRSKKRGLIAYSRIIIREYMLFRPKRFKIYVNNRVLRKRAFMITFANSNQFGFNAKISPKASVTDGLIDVCVLHKPPVYLAVFVILFAFMGLTHLTPFLEVYKAKEVRMIQRKNFIAHIDGDQITLSKQLIVKVNPLSLKVIIP